MGRNAITKLERAAQKQQRPVCIWLTGIPAAGKSTIAQELERRLHALGRHTYVLDGDQLRTGLNQDLGFTPAARAENIRRAAEVAKLMVDAGLIVICAFISPFRTERRFARSLLAPGEFVEVFLDAPAQVCEARDPKGHYARARRGEIPNFTGIDGSYERPETPELHLDTEHSSINECVTRILQVI
ncbi:adenosine 5'-phosphosulfate kinase [Burkholderiales bacterium]|nr:adenosine 5'-phosphosulfate kinase [Burkholderiales bacterium]